MNSSNLKPEEKRSVLTKTKTKDETEIYETIKESIREMKSNFVENSKPEQVLYGRSNNGNDWQRSRSRSRDFKNKKPSWSRSRSRENGDYKKDYGRHRSGSKNFRRYDNGKNYRDQSRSISRNRYQNKNRYQQNRQETEQKR